MELPKNNINVDFCIPIYNEEKILRRNALELYNYCKDNVRGYEWKIILVINGSSDSSLQIGKELKSLYREIDFVNYSEGGRGRALKNYWLKSRADIVAYMDVDLAVSLKNIDDLIMPIINNGVDLTIGSRLLSSSKIERSFAREFISQSHLFLSRLILKHNFSDLQCGFKAIKKSSFNKIASKIQNPRWFFDTELIYFAHRQKMSIQEVPVDWSENRYDERKSKVNILTDSLRAIINLIKLRIKSSISKNI